jgi:hypothetical protein
VHYSIADFVLDIVQNAIEAKSTLVTVDIIEDEKLAVCIGDNGSGMSGDQLSRVRDPFYTDGSKHDTRHTGLGIPFVEQAARASGGEFDIRSEEGTGTSVYFSFDPKNIDCPPLGDLVSASVSMMLFEGDYDLLINRIGHGGKYSVSRRELEEALDSLYEAGSANLVREFFRSREEEIDRPCD